ncbi:MAG: flavin reductase family protein [Syntrophobacteraceae bacterium]|jgi:flavin reductase (DIM6/NTAB) family NADH-FMN oxidoreductase RutF|nr:flavin reductase family protein [Syntrophobacteraceae bacterium]
MELSPEMFKRFLPLPVTVITTMDVQGVPNAAPYSCVMPILRPLPLIAIASALPRDTLRNIRSTGEFVVNVMGRPAFREAMKCAREYPPEVNELEEAGLETLPSKRVGPPRVRAAVGWIEATLDREVTDERYALIIGRVVCSEMNDLYVRNEKLTELPITLVMPHFRALGESVARRDEIEADITPMQR